jgi:hypothetical protein
MVWHKKDSEVPIGPSSFIKLSSHVSAIVDQNRGEAVLLDERNGRYWHLSAKLLEIVLTLGKSSDGLSFRELASHLGICNEHEEDCLRKAIYRLEASGLIRREKEELRQPSLTLVLRYALLYLWYQIILQVRGWNLIWTIRSKQQKSYRELSTNGQLERNTPYLQVLEEVIAAIRLASVFPWVRHDCIPSSLATYHLLRTMKYSPILMIGAKVVPFEPHMWVELGGYRMDAEMNEHSLDAFDDFSELLTSQEE